MKLDTNANTSNLIQAMEDDFSSSSPTAMVSIMTNSDGDYFIKMCSEEGGGIEPGVASFFYERPIGKRLPFTELMRVMEKVKATPCFVSLDGSVRLDYVLHIWISGYYIVHSPATSQSRVAKMTIIDRLFHPIKAI